MRTEKVVIDDRLYNCEIHQRITSSPEVPRLVIVSRQQNDNARRIVHSCIKAIKKYTPEAHELWVVDNNSPDEFAGDLLNYSNVNVVFNRTDPLPPEGRHREQAEKDIDQLKYDSYSNGVALEIAAQLIDPATRHLMSLHMDTMPCKDGWLFYLISKIQGKIGASGVRMDKTRTPEGVLHVLGYIVDFQLFKRLQLTYLPSLPQYDVGDLVTIGLRRAGFNVFACHNTLWETELVDKIPDQSPLKQLSVDRSFNDDWEVIFLHLGRGVRKSLGVHVKGTGPEEWLAFANSTLEN